MRFERGRHRKAPCVAVWQAVTRVPRRKGGQAQCSHLLSAQLTAECSPPSTPPTFEM